MRINAIVEGESMAEEIKRTGLKTHKIVIEETRRAVG
jgi:hypothetical protein